MHCGGSEENMEEEERKVKSRHSESISQFGNRVQSTVERSKTGKVKIFMVSNPAFSARKTGIG